MVGQRVRVYVENRLQPGVVEKVCAEPNSYSIRLLDGRAFRRTSNAINLDQSSSASFGAVLPSAGPSTNPHAVVTTAQQQGSASLQEPRQTPISSAATAVGTSGVTPGRSFSSVVNGTPVPSAVQLNKSLFIVRWYRVA